MVNRKPIQSGLKLIQTLDFGNVTIISFLMLFTQFAFFLRRNIWSTFEGRNVLKDWIQWVYNIT